MQLMRPLLLLLLTALWLAACVHSMDAVAIDVDQLSKGHVILETMTLNALYSHVSTLSVPDIVSLERDASPRLIKHLTLVLKALGHYNKFVHSFSQNFPAFLAAHPDEGPALKTWLETQLLPLLESCLTLSLTDVPLDATDTAFFRDLAPLLDPDAPSFFFSFGMYEIFLDRLKTLAPLPGHDMAFSIQLLGPFLKWLLDELQTKEQLLFFFVSSAALLDAVEAQYAPFFLTLTLSTNRPPATLNQAAHPATADVPGPDESSTKGLWNALKNNKEKVSLYATLGGLQVVLLRILVQLADIQHQLDNITASVNNDTSSFDSYNQSHYNASFQ